MEVTLDLALGMRAGVSWLPHKPANILGKSLKVFRPYFLQLGYFGNNQSLSKMVMKAHEMLDTATFCKKSVLQMLGIHYLYSFLY